MKRHKLLTCGALILSILALAYTMSAPSRTAAASPAFEPVTTWPFRRLYHPASNFHFYTADPAEWSALKQQPGWTAEEQTAGWVFLKPAPGTVPLYRLAKSEFGGANHFYTTDMDEANNAIQNLGWINEKIACWISPKQIEGTVPLYRLYKANGDAHFYTINPEEKFKAIYDGYQLVGTVGYVWMKRVTLGASPNPDSPAPVTESYYTKQLLNLGCTQAPGGNITCPTVPAYGICEDYRKAGKIKAAACIAGNLDLAAFNKIEANIVDAGCRRYAGRAGEYICDSWDGGEACEAARRRSNGLITKCYTPRKNLLLSYQESFGRDPNTKEIDYWAGQIKANKLTYEDLLKAHRQWIKTPEAESARKYMALSSIAEVFGRLARADEVNYITSLIAQDGRSYAELVKGHVAWMTGDSPQQTQELREMIGRAFASAEMPQPSNAQYDNWMTRVTAQKLTFLQVVALLKK